MSIKRLEARSCRLLTVWLALAGGLAPGLCAQRSQLEAGYWVVAKGEDLLAPRATLSDLEVTAPEEQESLVGTVSRLADDASWFELLGQRVTLSDKTRWRGLRPEELLGTRVKVEGYYRGPRKFSARTITRRKQGRDSITGRVDAVRAASGGLELDVMRFALFLPDALEVEAQRPLAELERIDARAPSRTEALGEIEGTRARDDDDYIPGTIRLSDSLTLGLLMEAKSSRLDNLNLDSRLDADRSDQELSLRAELTWRPFDDFYVLGGARQSIRWRDDEEQSRDELVRLPLVELYGYWTDVFGLPVDLQVGLQDFDEPREWLWDENLDAVRAIWKSADTRLELAAATKLHDGSPRAEATDTFIAYLYRESAGRLLGAYVVDTRTNLNGDDFPVHMGARMLGEWLPDNDIWAELAFVRGYRDDIDIRGWGFDLGTSWSPSFADPWYFNAGYAFGSGDDDPGDGVDHSFRQTGLHDNNDKFGGVTSYKYYGEVLEPELSNMSILTLGFGRRFARRHSIDLAYHEYRQDEPANRLRSSQLDMRPNGLDTDLGRGLDLVFGSRLAEGFDLELVLGTFEPGDAFDGGDRAYLGSLQLRMRF